MENYNYNAIVGFHLVIRDEKEFYWEENPNIVSLCGRNNLDKDIAGTELNFSTSIFAENPNIMLGNFMSMRVDVMSKSKSGAPQTDLKFGPFITHVDLFLRPTTYKGYLYQKIFNALNFAKQQRIIAPKGSTVWKISCGNLSNAPVMNQILNLVAGEKVCFLVDGINFDEVVANELSTNPMASVEVPFNAGTQETLQRIAGMDIFQRVIENIVRYPKFSCTQGQVKVKYKIFSDINDSDKDFVSCANILKSLQIKEIILSKNANENTVDSAGRFMAICGFYGITTVMDDSYNFLEQQKILDLGIKILEEALKQ